MLKVLPTFILVSLQLVCTYGDPVSLTAATIRNYQNTEINWDTWKPSNNVATQCPYYISGFDVDKRPILIAEIGKCPVRTLLEKGGQDANDLSTHILKAFHIVETGSRGFLNGSDLGAEDSVIIFDWEGFGLTDLFHLPTTRFFLYHFKAFEKIQEKCAYGYFINANAAVSQLLRLGRPLLGSVMERIEIYGTQKNRWASKLLRTIPRDQVPSKYGGSKGDFKPVAIYG